MVAHCLFEQSGTFKKEFLKLGYQAIDYDIQNEFGQTDQIIDLFAEIRGGYEGKPSIFDNMTPDDLILAFFPCTRFEAQIQLWFAGNNYSQTKWTDIQKLEKDIELHEELDEFYCTLSKLVIIALKRGLRLVVENPYTQPHYLTTYWCIKPKVIDYDRTENGDYYKKPTQYFFVGFEPKQNILFEALDYVPRQRIDKIRNQTARSMIHPQYANRFIRKYLIDWRQE